MLYILLPLKKPKISTKNIPTISLFVFTVLFMWTFHPIDYVLKSQFVFSQQEEYSSSSGGFLNMDLIWGFVGALGVLIPIATGIAYALKRSVNASTQEFMRKQSENFEKERKETRDQIKNHQDAVSTQISNVNNNVNEKFLASKESIIDIKNTIQDIDEKLDESRTQNTENRMRLNDVERRITNLEQNRHSNSAIGSFGIK
jgi:gas vesicle protein